MSRKVDDQIEWMLSKSVFDKLTLKWGMPEIDLFASRLNKQVAAYCSYRPDPGASYVNAFSISWHEFYAFINPPFSLLGRLPAENSARGGQLHGDCADLDYSSVVSGVDGPINRLSRYTADKGRFACATRSGCAAPTEENISNDGVSCLREQYRKRGLSENASRILLASWKSGTKKQYSTFFRRWFHFCRQRSCDPFSTNVESVVEFLTSLFDNYLGYSAINTARGALSSLGLLIDGVAAGCHPLIVRFLKGVYSLRPSQPRYSHTWDASVVLNYLINLSPVQSLTLKELSLKLVMLIALTSVSRVQGLKYLKISNMRKSDNCFQFCYTDLLKTNRPGFKSEMVLKEYTPDRRLCVYSVLEKYLVRTASMRKCDFFTHQFCKAT